MSALSVLARIACPGKRFPKCFTSSAAAPVALGVLILVPLIVPYAESPLENDDVKYSPFATTSGLMRPSSVGPHAEKLLRGCLKNAQAAILASIRLVIER